MCGWTRPSGGSDCNGNDWHSNEQLDERRRQMETEEKRERREMREMRQPANKTISKTIEASLADLIIDVAG